jgi:peptidoglycan/LPS O-acetylase OafA/YrhL
LTAILYTKWSLGAALILPAMSTWRSRPAYIGTPITALAAISYSLYLAHIPAAYLIRSEIYQMSDVARWTLWIAASLALAAFAYWLIERPSQSFGRSMSAQMRSRRSTMGQNVAVAVPSTASSAASRTVV